MRLVLEDLDLAQAERRLLEMALDQTSSLLEAAALLRISVREFGARMHRLGLQDRPSRPAEFTELDTRYMLACQRMRAIHEMPDRLEGLFIRLCWQNNYTLPADRRETRFYFLTDEEVTRLERAVREAFTWPLLRLKAGEDE